LYEILCMNIPLSISQRIELKNLHRLIKEKRKADRLKMIVMLDEGFSDIQISRILMFDEETVSSWRVKFESSVSFGEFLNHKYEGYNGKLNSEQILQVIKYIIDNIISDSKLVRTFA